MMATCPICGTRRVIYWPEHWVYRRGETYYCSEDCMIVDQTKDMKLIKMIAHVRAQKGSKMVKKIGDEQKAQAVRIALGGGNPLPYLKQCGSKNPSASWAYIKNCLAKKDPETFAKIEAEQPGPKPKIETPETNPFMKKTVRPEIETPEAKNVKVVEVPERPAKKPIEYKVTGIQTEVGEFWVVREGKIKWVPGLIAKEDPVMQVMWPEAEPALVPEMWRRFAEIILYVLDLLEVES